MAFDGSYFSSTDFTLTSMTTPLADPFHEAWALFINEDHESSTSPTLPSSTGDVVESTPTDAIHDSSTPSQANGLDPTAPSFQPRFQSQDPNAQPQEPTDDNLFNISTQSSAVKQIHQPAPTAEHRITNFLQQWSGAMADLGAVRSGKLLPHSQRAHAQSHKDEANANRQTLSSTPIQRPKHAHVTLLQQRQHIHYQNIAPQPQTGNILAARSLHAAANKPDVPAPIPDRAPHSKRPVQRPAQLASGNRSTEARVVPRGHSINRSAGEDHIEVINKENDGVETFEDILDDLGEFDGQIDSWDEQDPFTKAEEWIKEYDEEISSYPLPNCKDDVEEMKKPRKIIEIAAKMRAALLAPHQKPPAHWEPKKKASYEANQNKSRDQLAEILSDGQGERKALAEAIRLVGYICKIHSEGIPETHRSDKRIAGDSYYKTELHLKCSERCEKVIQAIRASKTVGIDVMSFEDRKMTDLARCPTKYLSRKAQNVIGNDKKNKRLKLGRDVERNAEEAELSQEQADADEDRYAEAGAEDPEVIVSTTRSRKGASSKRMGQTTSQAKSVKHGKRTRTMITEEDGEDTDEVELSQNSKRTKASAAQTAPLTTRAGRRGGRKRNGRKAGSNFPDVPEATPAATTPVEQQNHTQLPRGTQMPVGFGIPAVGGSEGMKDRPIDLADDDLTEESTNTNQPDAISMGSVFAVTDFSNEQTAPGVDQTSEDLLSQVGSWSYGSQGVSGGEALGYNGQITTGNSVAPLAMNWDVGMGLSQATGDFNGWDAQPNGPSWGEFDFGGSL